MKHSCSRTMRGPVARGHAHRLLAACTLCIAALPLEAAPPAGYRLAWQDEFDGGAVDESKWQYRTGVRFWSTQLAENVSVSDGLLHLHLRKQTVGTTNYTAGGVISRKVFRYGFYEARMKVPPGGGWHTSFWMMRFNRPADATEAIELDVIENDSVDPLKYGVNTHRHVPTPHLTYGNKNVATPSLSDDFHVFGCEFTPSFIRYFFDGVLVQTVDATQFAHDDLNIWLTSVAAPLGGTTSVDDSRLPAVADYDWVRFYEPFPAPTPVITRPTSSAVMLRDAADILHLDARIDAATAPATVSWSCVAGPGSVRFADASSAATTAAFTAPGNYVLECAATNEGGTTTNRVNVGVASPAILTLRQGTHGYSHAATLIRADYTDWNAGARDQLIVGRTSAPVRALFSFDLTPLPADGVLHQASLELTTVGGSGNVGTLGLRRLTATPVEGTGIADGTFGSQLGTGSGSTWLSRTGGTAPADLWAAPGADFESPVLASLAGYDATVSGETRVLPGTPSLVAAITAARATAKPLDLILSSDNESKVSGFTRLASDDDPFEHRRPALKLTFTGNLLPAVDPGPAPTVLAGAPTVLGGSSAGGDSSFWQSISGPAAVTFTNPADPATRATFPLPGVYRLTLAASNPLGTVERMLTVSVAPNPGTFAGWQEITWPGADDLAITGPAADPDRDGQPNFLEWALALDPLEPDPLPVSLAHSGGVVEFSYRRRRTMPGEVVHQVEWSDTLAGNWSAVGVSEDPPLALTRETESVLARFPAGSSGRRFARLRVFEPVKPANDHQP